MNWKINYVGDRRIVQVKPSGPMSWDDKKKFGEEALAAGRKRNINAFLLNQKETAFGLSVLEINRLPAVLKNAGFGQKDKVSILLNSDSVKGNLLGFLQNILSLGPLQIKVFIDRRKATAWLKARSLKRANPAFEFLPIVCAKGFGVSVIREGCCRAGDMQKASEKWV